MSAFCYTLNLDLRQGLIVLKSSLFSIIWQFLGHGGEHFCLWGPAGVMACEGDGTRVGDELATMPMQNSQVYLYPYIYAQATNNH